jgi:hypothetical protein
VPKIRVALLVFLLFCTFAFINIGVASSSSYITLDPTDLEFNAAGEEIETRVVFSNLPDFYAFDIEINFDPETAEVISLEEGSAIKGKNSFKVKEEFDNDKGSVRIAKSLLGDDVLPSEGELAVITFRAKATGNSLINVNSSDIVVLTEDGPDSFIKDPSGTVARPVANPAGGAVTSGSKVTLTTATPGADIYYTTDGSAPTANSTKYTGPITINEDVTIKAIAVKDGMMNSEVLTASFTTRTDTGSPGGGGGGGGGPSTPPTKELEISPDDPEKTPGIEMLKDIAGHWAENNIQELVALGAISGYPDGTFKPNNNITRAEFATVLVKAFQLEPQSGKVFKDTAGHWAQEAISTAASYSIVGGYSADTFGPDDLITREQMAVMVVKAAELAPATVELSFTDSDSISEWAREAMTTAVASGIIGGYPDNTLRPKGNATRAEAATIIVNALQELV